jgi:hypothetical protein
LATARSAGLESPVGSCKDSAPCIRTSSSLLSGDPRYKRLRTFVGDAVTARGRLEVSPRWLARFLLRRRTDAWYASLFRPQPGQLAGEVTPVYDRLGEDVVARIHQRIPGLKVLFFMRDPIDRIWPEAALNLRKHAAPTVARQEVAMTRRIRERPNFHKSSDYLGNLARWERVFPPEQIFVGFFDQLVEAPGSLLLDVLRFLGVSDDPRHLHDGVAVRRNAEAYPSMPEELRRELHARYRPDLKALHARFDNPYTAAWLAKSGISA